MSFLIFKYAVTAFIIVLVSEVAKRSGKIGALITSLPFVTIIAVIWMYYEIHDTSKISNYAYYTLWYVVPTLPMFAVMPYMLNRGFNFWFTLVICILVTFTSFIITAYIGRRFGVDLML